MYFMLKAERDNNKSYSVSNWAFQIKSILDSIRLSYIWIQQSEIEIPFNLIKMKILDIYKQAWYSSINNSNRLSAYARLNTNLIVKISLIL